MKAWVKTVLTVGLALQGSTTLLGTTITLTENTGAGKTFSGTADTHCEWSSAADRHYNQGGATSLQAGTATGSSYYRVALLKFDLTVLPDIRSINSATLRVYQTSSDTSPKAVQRILEDWVEGTSPGAWGDIYNGASTYARNQGNHVDNTDLVSTNHLGENVWYFGGVTNLALDPKDGVGHYIVRAANTTLLRNYDMDIYKLTRTNNLDNLATNLSEGTYAYYYDDAADRVYVRFNNTDIQWLMPGDLWIDSVWDGTETLGPGGSSLDSTSHYDTTDPNPGVGWYEFDVTAIVSNWVLAAGQNYGVCLTRRADWGNDSFTSSEGTDSQRPELVIDYVPPPPGGTMIRIR